MLLTELNNSLVLLTELNNSVVLLTELNNSIVDRLEQCCYRVVEPAT